MNISIWRPFYLREIFWLREGIIKLHLQRERERGRSAIRGKWKWKWRERERERDKIRRRTLPAKAISDGHLNVGAKNRSRALAVVMVVSRK